MAEILQRGCMYVLELSPLLPSRRFKTPSQLFSPAYLQKAVPNKAALQADTRVHEESRKRVIHAYMQPSACMLELHKSPHDPNPELE